MDLKTAVQIALRGSEVPDHPSVPQGRETGTPAEPQLVAGPILAWRAWRIRPRGSRLFSMSQDTPWEPRKAMVTSCACRPWSLCRGCEGKLSPHNGGSCGIYAAPTYACAIRKFVGELSGNVCKRVVVGLVALWGRVIRHDDGYRAEKAYPVLLDARWVPAKIGSGLSRVYGVPCLVFTVQVHRAMGVFEHWKDDDGAYLFMDPPERSGRHRGPELCSTVLPARFCKCGWFKLVEGRLGKLADPQDALRAMVKA